MVPSTIGAVLAGEKQRLKAIAGRDGTLTVWLDSDPRTLNPLVEPTVWTLRISSDTVFENLLRYHPGRGRDGPGTYEGRLAKSWRVVGGGSEIAVEIRPDVHFHDGARLSSTDVQFSIDAARSGRTHAERLRRMLAAVRSVDLSGPHGVRIELARPDARVLRALAEVPILPAHVYEKNMRTAGPGAPVVGTGPYRLGTWQDGSVTLERWDGYWGERPAIPSIVFRYEADAARALELAREGEIDVIPALIRAHYPSQARAPGVAADWAPLRLRPASLRYLVLNTQRPPFDDAEVRCALSRVLDRAALVASDGGLARAKEGAVWPGGPGDGPAAPQAMGSAADAAATVGARASRLLVVLVSDRKDAERDQVLEQLRAAGLSLDTRVGSVAVLDNRLRDGLFDVAFVEWDGRAGSDLASLFGSGGVKNFGRFSDARVDQALAALKQAWEPAARWKAEGRLAEALAQTCPIVPLVAPDPYGLVSRRVHGVEVEDGWLVLRKLSLARGQR